jgi:hypothetical protein
MYEAFHEVDKARIVGEDSSKRSLPSPYGKRFSILVE